MSSFTAPLILEVADSERCGQGEFLVYQPFSYDVGYLGSGETITVPAGFKTDLASIPWFARGLVPIAGRCAKPALLHDWLLEHDDRRALAVFVEALDVAGVTGWRRWAIEGAVQFWAVVRQWLRAGERW